MMSVLTHFPPKSRLSELAAGFGGLSREEAVQAATRELEVMRPDSDRAILSAIIQLEEVVLRSAKSNDPVPMKQLLPLADQIVTLAGTFGYRALDKATRSLCDLLGGLLAQGKSDRDSIRVHIQTMHMFAPGAITPSEEQISVMLTELHKLLEFHGFLALDQSQDGEDVSIAPRVD